MSTIETLLAARDLIAQGWTQGVPARNAEGQSVAPTDPTATCWCIHGALRVAAGDAAGNARALLRGMIGDHFISRWNDSPERTQAEVLALFDRVIALAKV